MTSTDIKKYEMAKSLIQEINEIKKNMKLPLVETSQPDNPQVSTSHWSDDIAAATQRLNHKVEHDFTTALKELESIIKKI